MHLVIAHHRHHTQRMHIIALWIVGRTRVGVTKHYIRMLVGIKVVNTVLRQLILECSLVLPGLITLASAFGPISAVAVDVHVIVSATIALRVEIDGVVDVAAVGEGAVVEAAGEFIVAFAALERIVQFSGVCGKDLMCGIPCGCCRCCGD